MSEHPEFPELVDHIGWDLWQATEVWKRRFTRSMVSRGHCWYAEARGALIRHIGQRGVAQTELARRARMTKQAIQQHLDDLVADGIVERFADPKDARKKLIRFTASGRRALADANLIKMQIEDEYCRLIGPGAMASLKRSIELIVQADSQP